MKLSLVTFAVCLALASGFETEYTTKKADGEFLKKQAKVLSLYVGLGSNLESRDNYQHKPFPFNDAKFYKNGEALESFMKSYERGLLDRHGVFTLYCHKNRHDTFSIFDIMYFAKDFDTFFDIAHWAYEELNPLQFYYTFTMAVIHREDTRGFYVPPVYEVFPYYFVQSFYMNEANAYHTYHDKEAVVVHQVNKTGWERSWHEEMTGGVYPTGPRWNGDDYNNRVSYLREDAAWGNSFEFFNMKFANWLSTDKYPDIHFSHRGDIMYFMNKWVLDRYNLDRMSYLLPAITAFETDKPLPGYNSHLTDYMGRSFLVRSDGIVPEENNPDATWYADATERRFQKAIDMGFFWTKQGMINTTEYKGFDLFSKMIFATRDSYNRKYYKALYYQLIHAAKDVVKTPNDRDYTVTALDYPMTQVRDPAFYMILANIDSWFNSYLETLPAYSTDMLSFPGVKFEKFEVSKLKTFFTRSKFELTNGLPFKHEEDRYKYRSFADQYVLDHEPFEYDFVVKSDKAQEAMLRVMVGPKYDSDGRSLSLNQMRRAFITLNKYIVKLNAGVNVFKKSGYQPEFYDKYQNFYDYYMKVNKSIQTDEPFEYSELTHCGFPYNLQLPRGWTGGKDYVMFVMVTPFSQDYIDKEGFYQCHYNKYQDKYPIGYPFDRVIRFPNEFVQSNMMFKDVKIYHDYFYQKE